MVAVTSMTSACSSMSVPIWPGRTPSGGVNPPSSTGAWSPSTALRLTMRASRPRVEYSSATPPSRRTSRPRRAEPVTALTVNAVASVCLRSNSGAAFVVPGG